MEKGFYFYTPSCDWFFVTNQTKKTQKLVEKIDEILKGNCCTYRGTFGTFNLSEMLQPATIEKGESEKFGVYYNIKGKGFSAGDFLKNKLTQIVRI
jgi:hypothetical protein